MCFIGSSPRHLNADQKKLLGFKENDPIYLISHTINDSCRSLWDRDEEYKYEPVLYDEDKKESYYNGTFEPLPYALCLLVGTLLLKKTSNEGITMHRQLRTHENKWYDMSGERGAVILNIQCNYTKEQLDINIKDFAKHYRRR